MADDAERTDHAREPVDVAALVAALAREAASRRLYGRVFFALVGVWPPVVLAYCGALVLAPARVHALMGWISPDLVMGPAIIALTLGSTCAGAFLNKRSKTPKVLAYGDTRAIGPLAEVMGATRVQSLALSEPVHAQAAALLAHLLPQMRPSDGDRLTDAQWSALVHLARSLRTELVQAILVAFERLGDPRVLPVVEELAAGRHSARTDVMTRRAAEACLPALRERVRRDLAAALLLRPADAPGDTLLRPAQGAAPADEALLLLRASKGESADE